MSQPFPTHPNAPTSPAPKRKRFGGMAVAALVLGIIALCGSPIPILNNATIIAGVIGIVFAVIGLFGWRKVMASIGGILAVAGVVVGIMLQVHWGQELGKIGAAPVVPVLPAQQAGAATSTPNHSAQGFIPKKLGESGGLTAQDGSGASNFTIDKITVDPKCSKYGSKPETGHTVVLAVRAATGSDADVVRQLSAALNPYSFQFVGADGVTQQVSPGICTDPTKSLSSTQMSANSKYSGTIELVVPDTHGKLICQYTSIGDDSGSMGWEWTF